MNKQVANILSGIFFGVFTAPILSIIWFIVPWLRYFPVGEDSPHGVALPLGLCLGMGAGFALNRSCRWGRAGAIGGAILLFIAIVCSLAAFTTIFTSKGIEKLGSLGDFYFCFNGVVAALGLMLSAIFSQKCA